MFFDIVDMTTAYIQYLVLLSRISPDSYPAFYSQPFIALKYIILNIFESFQEEQRYSNPLNVTLPVWLPLDIRLQFFAISVAAPIGLTTVGILGLFTKIGYLWDVCVLCTLTVSMLGLFVLTSHLTGSPYPGTPGVATAALMFGLVLPLVVILFILGVRQIVRRHKRKTEDYEAELMAEIAKQQQAEDRGAVDRAGPPTVKAALAAAGYRPQRLSPAALAAEAVHMRHKRERVACIDLGDLIVQFGFALGLLFLGLFLANVISVPGLENLQASMVFRAAGGGVLALASLTAVWGGLGCFRKGRHLRVVIGEYAQALFISLIMIGSNFIYTSMVTNFISLVYCRDLVCEPGTRPPNVRSSMPVVEVVATNDGSIAGCVACNLHTYPQRCAASFQESLCAGNVTQSRLVYDPRVPCQLVDGYYKAAALLVFSGYIVYVPLLQYFLARVAVDLLQSEFPLAQRFIDALSPSEQFFEKVITSKNSANFVYRAYRPKYQYYKISFLAQRIILATASCVTCQGLAKSSAWMGISVFIAVPLLFMGTSLYFQPFSRPTEAIYFPVLQFLLAVAAALTLYGNSRLEAGGLPNGLGVLLAVLVIAVPLVTLIVATVMTLRVERRRYKLLRTRLERAFAARTMGGGGLDGGLLDTSVSALGPTVGDLTADQHHHADPVLDISVSLSGEPPPALLPGSRKGSGQGGAPASNALSPPSDTPHSPCTAADVPRQCRTLRTLWAQTKSIAYRYIVGDPFDTVTPDEAKSRDAPVAAVDAHAFTTPAQNPFAAVDAPTVSRPVYAKLREWLSRVRRWGRCHRHGCDGDDDDDEEEEESGGSVFGTGPRARGVWGFGAGSPRSAGLSPRRERKRGAVVSMGHTPVNPEYAFDAARATAFVPDLFFCRAVATHQRTGRPAPREKRLSLSGFLRKVSQAATSRGGASLGASGRESAPFSPPKPRWHAPARERGTEGNVVILAADSTATERRRASTGSHNSSGSSGSSHSGAHGDNLLARQGKGGEGADGRRASLLAVGGSRVVDWLRAFVGVPLSRGTGHTGGSCGTSAGNTAQSRYAREAMQQAGPGATLLNYNDVLHARHEAAMGPQTASMTSERVAVRFGLQRSPASEAHRGAAAAPLTYLHHVSGAPDEAGLLRIPPLLSVVGPTERAAVALGTVDVAVLLALGQGLASDAAVPLSASRRAGGGEFDEDPSEDDAEREALAAFREERLDRVREALAAEVARSGAPRWQEATDTMLGASEAPGHAPPWVLAQLAGRGADRGGGRQETVAAVLRRALAEATADPDDDADDAEDAAGARAEGESGVQEHPAPLLPALLCETDGQKLSAASSRAAFRRAVVHAAEDRHAQLLFLTARAKLQLAEWVFDVQQAVEEENLFRSSEPGSLELGGARGGDRPWLSPRPSVAGGAAVSFAPMGGGEEESRSRPTRSVPPHEDAQADPVAGALIALRRWREPLLAVLYDMLPERERDAGAGSLDSSPHRRSHRRPTGDEPDDGQGRDDWGDPRSPPRRPRGRERVGSLVVDTTLRAAIVRLREQLAEVFGEGSCCGRQQLALVEEQSSRGDSSTSSDGESGSHSNSRRGSGSSDDVDGGARARGRGGSSGNTSVLSYGSMMGGRAPRRRDCARDTDSVITTAHPLTARAAHTRAGSRTRRRGAWVRVLPPFLRHHNTAAGSAIALGVDRRTSGSSADTDDGALLSFFLDTPRGVGKAPVVGDGGGDATVNDLTAARSLVQLPQREEREAGVVANTSDTADPLVPYLRSHYLLRQRLKDAFWQQHDELVRVQMAVEHKINRFVRRLLTILFIALGLIAALALALSLTGMFNTVDMSFIDGTALDGEDVSSLSYQLAGYTSWEDFTEHCCCTSATNLHASFPLYTLDIEEWLCDNGNVKERVRRDGFQNKVYNGYAVRPLCGMNFSNGCHLVVSESSKTVSLEGCNTTATTPQERQRW